MANWWSSILDGQAQPTQPTARPNVNLTDYNTRRNLSWGDPLITKNQEHTRLYCNNLNGFKIGADDTDIQEISQIMLETNSDIGCFQEHKLDTTQSSVRYKCQTGFTKHLNPCKLTMSSSAMIAPHDYKPGGTMIVSRGSITGRHSVSGSDSLGRWSFQKFIGKNLRTIVVISAYQVCQTHDTKGKTTAFAQQQAQLATDGRASQDTPKESLH